MKVPMEQAGLLLGLDLATSSGASELKKTLFGTIGNDINDLDLYYRTASLDVFGEDIAAGAVPIPLHELFEVLPKSTSLPVMGQPLELVDMVMAAPEGYVDNMPSPQRAIFDRMVKLGVEAARSD